MADPVPAAPAPCALFLASTPLHSFWSLGLMHGPFAAWRNVLAIVDQKTTDRDFIGEVLARSPAGPVAAVRRFDELGGWRQARPILRSLMRWTAEWQPSYIAAGNDRRIEFHAAAHVAPGARRGYIEDGLFSYVGRKDMHPGRRGRLRRWLSGWRRSLMYGFPIEKPRLVGGSDAVQEGWVLLPEQVHAGLAGKTVHALRPEWYADPAVQAVCQAAAGLAEFDARTCADIRVLLLLPHESFLVEHPEIGERLEALARTAAAEGRLVAVKCHPSTRRMPIGLPESGCVEIPRRLPIEILAPLLSDARVVGTLTTALISLQLLGRRLEVRSVFPPQAQANARQRAYNEQTSRIYESVGIRPFA